MEGFKLNAAIKVVLILIIFGILCLTFIPSVSIGALKSPPDTSSTRHRGFRPEKSKWVGLESNPVLPDAAHSDTIGTVFDVSVLYEDGLYKMYGSWRPNDSISYSTSTNGVTWDQELRFSLGGVRERDWEQWVNRPSVLKRATGEYLMWYVLFAGMSD